MNKHERFLTLFLQKYDLKTKIGRVKVSFESSRLQAPPKPGTGVLEKILLEPD
jgi:hypothetical protein